MRFTATQHTRPRRQRCQRSQLTERATPRQHEERTDTVFHATACFLCLCNACRLLECLCRLMRLFSCKPMPCRRLLFSPSHEPACPALSCSCLALPAPIYHTTPFFFLPSSMATEVPSSHLLMFCLICLKMQCRQCCTHYHHHHFHTHIIC